MSIGEKFATRNEVEALRRKLELAITGKGIFQSITPAPSCPAIPFTELTDVPQTYAAAGNWIVRVKSTVDELEFADLKGTTNQVYVTENAADYTLSLPQDIHTAATPTFAGMYLTSSSAAPFLKLTNESNTARDPILQFAVGATPIVKWTWGLDDSDDDNLTWCNGDALVDTTTKIGGDKLGIVDTGNSRIKTHLSADSLLYVSKFGSNGSGDDQFDGPRGICTDGTYYYIVDAGNHRIKKHRISDGLFIWAVGTNGAGDDQFTIPWDICTDKTYLYITDSVNNRIKKHLCTTGAYVTQATDSGGGHNYNQPQAICTHGGYLYITQTSGVTLPRISKVRCSDLVADSHMHDDTYIDNATLNGICTDGFHLFLSNTNNAIGSSLYKYTKTLVYVSGYGTAGSGNTQFDSPYGICADTTYLYIVDTTNRRIKKHRISDWSFVAEFGTVGSGDNQFSDSRGICIIPTEDERLGRLLRLHEDGTFFDVWPKLSLYNTLVFREDSVAQVNYVEVKAPTSITSYTLILPDAAAEMKKHLFSDATNILDWGQNVDTDGTPSFDHLHLSATSNQIVLQSTGVTGTITATPASSNKVWTLQDVTGTIYQTGGTDVAVADGGTNKSAWTLYAIPYASGTTTIGEIAIGTAGRVLAVNGGANGYEWISGVLVLGDLTDVDFPSGEPDIGDVLTYESGGWTSMPPAGGAAAFLDLTDVDEADYVGHEAEFVVVNGTADGLVFSASSVAGHTLGGVNHTDVDAAAPNDNDILRYDTVSGTWIAEVLPATGGGDFLVCQVFS